MVDAKQKLVEVTRSFSYKHNSGGYESRDFFMSFKVECEAKNAALESRKAHEFCKQEVLRSVKEWKQGIEVARARLKKQSMYTGGPDGREADGTPF